MKISITELKTNLSKYLQLSATEDILITKKGRVISKLTNPSPDRVEVAKSLFGVLPPDKISEQPNAETLAALLEAEKISKDSTVKGCTNLEE